MYTSLLENGDSIRKLHITTRLDLQDYINMTERGLPCVIKWKQIRSNWVTTNGQTIWQLTEKFFNKDQRAIGASEPPINLIKWILTNG